MRPTRRLSRPHRPRSLLLWGSHLVAWLLVGTSLFLSLWIVLPAPTRSLLPLGVGAPEISPWLEGLSAISWFKQFGTALPLSRLIPT
ncbi:hypothetical protein [Halomicronema sp. CCY15110]|uniref:hypothetical protein n=1 Tax=Halomicronema sp. CCY15110 TaxID=2767773 RepID=UPI001EF39DEF|nr:hypothetical protein [Halomicronema sp. CCY15110]